MCEEKKRKEKSYHPRNAAQDGCLEVNEREPRAARVDRHVLDVLDQTLLVRTEFWHANNWKKKYMYVQERPPTGLATQRDCNEPI